MENSAIDFSYGEPTLAELLAIDRSGTSPTGSLPNCFGDRYLCRENVMYGSLRQRFLEFGCVFQDVSESGSDYNAAPLLLLQELMASGVVPVFSNSDALARIARAQPDVSGGVVRYIRKNYVLHESAHCLAYRVLGRYFRDQRLISEKQSYVLLCLLCESFANTVERVAAASAAESSAHELIFSANSYVEPQHATMVGKCIQSLRLETVLLLGMITCLRQNLNLPWTQQDLRGFTAVWRAAGLTISPAEEFVGEIVLQQAFHVNRTFTSETNRLYFQYHQCAEEYGELCADRGTTCLNQIPFIFDGAQELIRLVVPAGEQ